MIEEHLGKDKKSNIYIYIMYIYIYIYIYIFSHLQEYPQYQKKLGLIVFRL